MIDFLFAGAISALFLALLILSIVASRIGRGSAMTRRAEHEAFYLHGEPDESPPWEAEQTA